MLVVAFCTPKPRRDIAGAEAITCGEEAHDVLGVDYGWGRWALGALVPGLCGLALLPLLLKKLAPPELRTSPEAGLDR